MLISNEETPVVLFSNVTVFPWSIVSVVMVSVSTVSVSVEPLAFFQVVYGTHLVLHRAVDARTSTNDHYSENKAYYFPHLISSSI